MACRYPRVFCPLGLPWLAPVLYRRISRTPTTTSAQPQPPLDSDWRVFARSPVALFLVPIRCFGGLF
jgi:hypothetical protein